MDKISKDRALFEQITKKRPLELTRSEKLQLVSLVKASYHDSGKIEGLTSIDGSALSCEFCQAMRKAAEKDATIVCGGCYAAALDKLRNSAERRHALNQDILSYTVYSIAELSIIPINTIYNRFNSDGDCRNVEQARNYIRIAKAHPYTKHALWFKNLDAVSAAVAIDGKPENLVIIFSPCHIGQNNKRIMDEFEWIDYTFTVYPDHKTTNAAVAAGACECNGKKCRDCGFACYAGTWPKHSNIAEYLRGVNKEKRAALVAACCRK